MWYNCGMRIKVFLAVLACKCCRSLIRLLGRGGTDFPGRVALKICPNLLGYLAKDVTTVIVTGTNGKTTVTSLTAHLLRAAGMDAVAVGNIGDTCLAAVAADPARVFVAETSSYQLESTSRFAPDAAVLLNITPDHLKWHGSFEAYRDAKFKALAAKQGIAIDYRKAGSPAMMDTDRKGMGYLFPSSRAAVEYGNAKGVKAPPKATSSSTHRLCYTRTRPWRTGS